MKPTVFAIIASFLSIAGLAAADDPRANSIILGKFFPTNVHRPTIYAAWAALSSPCEVTPAFIAPTDRGLCGHPFTVGNNPNFTNVEVEDCQDFLPDIQPVIAGASPVQLCIPESPSNLTCDGGKGSFEFDLLCGGPLTTG